MEGCTAKQNWTTPSRTSVSEFIRQLSLTFYKRKDSDTQPALVYCHSFSGNKVEGQFLLESALEHFVVCLFDFRGCGNSEEQFVTLGLREKTDLRFVLRIVSQSFNPDRIYLWGRSMGAVAIIHHLHFLKQVEQQSLSTKTNRFSKVNSQCEDHVGDCAIGKKIGGVVFDSPFHDSHSLVVDFLNREKSIPKFIGSWMMGPVSQTIKEKVKFDVLGDNKPIALVPDIQVPAFFMLGHHDQMIDHGKFKEMFTMYGSPKKELRIVDKVDHSCERPDQMVKEATDFLLKIEKAKRMAENPNCLQPLHSKANLEKIIRVNSSFGLNDVTLLHLNSNNRNTNGTPGNGKQITQHSDFEIPKNRHVLGAFGNDRGNQKRQIE